MKQSRRAARRKPAVLHVTHGGLTPRRSPAEFFTSSQSRAYELLTVPEARAAFDLSREKESTREAYGQTSFGQSCLLARRLVQAGVSYVQVNWSQYVEAMTPN